MATTLKVKNESTKDVILRRAGAAQKVTIGAGKEADLDEPFLAGDVIRPFIESGALRFVDVAEPTPEQVRLARRVLPPLLATVGHRFIGLHDQVTASIRTMRQLRDGYNLNWAAHNRTVSNAKPAADPAARLADSVAQLLNSEPEQAEVDRIKAEITTLEAEDLSATPGRTLAEWYTDREVKARQLAAAEAALARAKRDIEGRHGAMIKALKQAAADLTSLKPDKVIGSALPTTW